MKLAKKYNGNEMENIIYWFIHNLNNDITIDDVIEVINRCTSYKKQEAAKLNIIVNHIDSFEKHHENVVMNFFYSCKHLLNTYSIDSYSNLINTNNLSSENKDAICKILIKNASSWHIDRYVNMMDEKYKEELCAKCDLTNVSHIYDAINVFGEDMIIQQMIKNVQEEYIKKSVSGIHNKLEFLLTEKTELSHYSSRSGSMKKFKANISTVDIMNLYAEFKSIDFGEKFDKNNKIYDGRYYKILDMFRKYISIDEEDKMQKDKFFIKKIISEEYNCVSKKLKEYNISIADAVQYIISELTENNVELPQDFKDQLTGYEVMKAMLK